MTTAEQLIQMVPVEAARRGLRARVATPGVGIADPIYPSLLMLVDMIGVRRTTLHLWFRLTNAEDLRLIRTRVIRCLGPEGFPGEGAGDAAMDPVDLVATVAGLLFPGLDTWRKVKTGPNPQELMVDMWWGTWGLAPGAVVFRDGVLHLVHMDRDTETMMKCSWLKWAAKNWPGPVLHHAIQVQGEDPSASSSAIITRLGKGGGRSGCILWPSTAGLDLRPFRVDMAGEQALIRSLGTGFRVGTLPKVPLNIRGQIPAYKEFWSWVESLEVPHELRVPTPLMTRLDMDPAENTPGCSQGAKAVVSEGVMATPLFDEVSEPTDELFTVAAREFGVPIVAELGQERITAMFNTAKSELVRATMAHNRRKQDHWRVVLGELQHLLAEEVAK